jgi:hypothetical protein
MNEEEQPTGEPNEDYSGLGYILVPVFYTGALFAFLAALYSTNSAWGRVASILTCLLFIFLGRKVGKERTKSTVLLYLAIGLGLIALTYGLCLNDWHTFTY